MSYVLLDRPDSLIAPPLSERGDALSPQAEASSPHARVEVRIAALARQTPSRLAISDSNRRLSYHELNAQANQLARYLQRRGVRSETLIGVCMDRSVEMVVACLAILKAGGAYVPLDPAYPTERIAFMLADSRMPMLITKRSLHAALDPHVPMSICIDTDWPRIAEEVSEDLRPARALDKLAYVIYTSGSTGQPKGVQIEHRGLLNLIAWHQRAFAITAEDRATQLAGPAFDATVWELWPYLTIGASIHIPDETTRMDPAILRDYILDQEITACFAPTPLAEHLIELEWPAQASLRILLTGGDWLTRRPRAALPFTLINNYGPTENSVVSTSGPVSFTANEVPDIGHPIDNVRTYILDAQLQPVPAGESGELCVAGVGLARGYLNRPDLTAEKFVRDPFVADPSERMYRTGDLVRTRPNGTIEFLGRIDHQVKIRGFRIELGEIDAVLKQHYAVRDAVVEAREFDRHGAREKRLIAFVAPTDRQLIASAELVADLRTFIKAKLPEYMVPPTFVMLEALPLTPNGKIDRAALPAPAADELLLDAASAPRTPTEALLASLWAKALGRASMSIHDDFFALGGHSLLAAHVVALTNQALSQSAPVSLLYRAPTIAAFAQALEGDAQLAAAITVAELQADVTLDPSIVPPSDHGAADIYAPNAIFLTGATGFLGAFLLDQLLRKTSATIYCLVRAANPREGRRRIERTLTEYQLELGDRMSRIIPMVGDLGQDQLGLDAESYRHLATTVDVIYHTGAQVHYLHPYNTLRAANVQGTVEVLRLACQDHLKPVHYVSTIAVAAAAGKQGLLKEDDVLTTCTSPKGYDQSKWVAESIIHLARARGIPVSIYRPGRIGAHSRTGAANTDDFFMRLLAGCIQLGLVLDFPVRENLVPVDFAAESIVYLSQQPEAQGLTYHLMNPQSTDWAAVIDTAQRQGYALQPVTYQEWRQAMIDVVEAYPEHPLHSLLTFIPADPADTDWIGYLDRQQFDMSNTLRELSHTQRCCPVVTAAYLERMLTNGASRGLYPSPSDQTASEAIALHPLTPMLA